MRTVEIKDTKIPGCVEVQPIVRPDDRGYFVKLFQRSVFEGLGLDTAFNEFLFSDSKAGVIRGLHFQTPPHAQGKLVFCVKGEVFDVAVDLRKGSPTYGEHVTFHLSEEKSNGAFIPAGFAHGFAALTDAKFMYFATGGEYNAEADGGIHWNSAGIEWPITDPILSDKDKVMPALDEFDSPFVRAS